MKKSLVIFLSLFLFCLCSNPSFSEIVAFNTQTLKFHSLGCRWAKKCTVNCIKIERKEAIRRGGVPCKTCGG